MKRVGVAELKAHLSREVRAAAAGETIIVLDRSHPVAQLGPLESGLTIDRHPTAGFDSLSDGVRLLAHGRAGDLLDEERGAR